MPDSSFWARSTLGVKNLVGESVRRWAGLSNHRPHSGKNKLTQKSPFQKEKGLNDCCED